MQRLEILLPEIPVSGFLHVTPLSVYTIGTYLWNKHSDGINSVI